MTHRFSPCFTGFTVSHGPEPEHRDGEGVVKLSCSPFSGQEAETEEEPGRGFAFPRASSTHIQLPTKIIKLLIPYYTLIYQPSQNSHGPVVPPKSDQLATRP